ncbi:MAG: EamA family transporter [Clostridia bacterium]|nr:EamA family transporter [Clostridia bacterium]
MTALLAILSIGSMVLQNGLLNGVCKKVLKTSRQTNFFNVVQYAVCVLIFGVMMVTGSISWYTAGIGVLFGIVTALGTMYKLLALGQGPMHITLLITTSSMIIPTLSGIFFGEGFSLAKFAVVVVLIACIYLSLGKQEGDNKFNGKWLLYCLISFVFLGLVGVLQKVHQTSAHKAETGGFLFVSFVCSMVFSLIRVGGAIKEMHFDKKVLLIGVVCGVCTYAMNDINLKLSGVLPTQLFFPLINGSAIVLSSLVSVAMYREQLDKRQWIGLVGGILSLIGICLVP